MKTLILFLSIFYCLSIFSQHTYINQEWVDEGSEIGALNRIATTTDIQGNIYTTSNSISVNGDTDVLVSKKDRYGNSIWTQTFNGSANGDDFGIQLTLDSNNDIFVACALQETTGKDFGILKYLNNGTLAWSQTWNGAFGGIDIPSDIAVDPFGDAYITGASQASNGFSDYAVIKYSSSGSFQWHTAYDFNNLHDGATSVTAYSDNVVVTGGSASSFDNWDYATLRLDVSNGSILDEQRNAIPGIGLDNAVAISTDIFDNIYVTGFVEDAQGKDIQTIKLDPNFGLEWVKTYDAGFDDVAKTIGTDIQGNVYVAGYSDSQNGREYITIKYDGSGNELWVNKFGGLAGVIEAEVNMLAVNDQGEVIVVGTTHKNGIQSFSTVGYRTDGALKFIKEYYSGGGEDIAEAISISGEDVYVTGTSLINGEVKLRTVKYSIKDKAYEYISDSNGRPMYFARDLIVRFDTSAMRIDQVDNEGMRYGKLSTFLKPNAVAQVQNAVKDICGNECDIDVYKVFPQLNSSITTTTSRLGDTIRVPTFWSTLLLEFPQGIDVKTIASEFDDMFALVKYSDLNVIAEIDEDANDAFYADWQFNLFEDPYDFPNAHVNVEPAWDLENGKPFVRVGVFDTGVQWTHEDYGDGTVDGTKIKNGWNFHNNTALKSEELTDINGHGTRTSGVIGAIRNNNLGIAGIAGGNDEFGNSDSTGVSLYGMKIFHHFNFDSAVFVGANTVAEAVVMSSTIDEFSDFGFGFHIMNNSWGSRVVDNNEVLEEEMNIYRDAYRIANQAQVTVIASSGNDGYYQEDNNFVVKYPAEIDDDWILTVGGTGFTGAYPVDPNASATRNWSIDVAAPSVGLAYTTDPGFSISDSGYGFYGGTSAAAPHVAGAAALLMSYLNFPVMHPANLSPEDVEAILQMTATDVDFPGVDSLTGYGRLNIGAALWQVHKDKYTVKHVENGFGANSSVSFSQQQATDTVRLLEPYENLNGQWFEEDVLFEVTPYKTSTIFIHSLSENDTILAAWPRHSVSNPLPNFNDENRLLPRERVQIESYGLNQAEISGYYYQVSDTSGNFLGYWPDDLGLNGARFGYTLLTVDTTSTITGLEEVIDFGELSLFPNPNDGIHQLLLETLTEGQLKIDLFDITGKYISEMYNSRVQAGNINLQIDFSNLSQGMYIYRIQLNDRVKNIKFSKL